MMKVEIWSDIVCPFCYIGKRRFEEALQESGCKNSVSIEWKSFQLNPDLRTDPSVNISRYLADSKGWTLEYAQNMNAHVTEMAAEVGLSFSLDSAVVANSFNAHRLIHLAREHGTDDAVKEALLKAYFTLGKNIDDRETLVEIGEEAGLDRVAIITMLNSAAYAGDVKNDIAEARYLNIRGVPFFVINGKYAVSGAQAVPVFCQTLEKAFEDWEQEVKDFASDDSEDFTCGAEGEC